jgi:hypothetical protein
MSPRWRGFAIRARSIHVMALTATAMQDFLIFAVCPGWSGFAIRASHFTSPLARPDHSGCNP